MSLTAFLFGLCAALAISLGAVLQSRAARQLENPPTHPLSLLLRLIRVPLWLLGAAFAGLSGLFHVVALRDGSLIEVESILVTSLLFALVFGVYLSKSPVTARDWFGATLTVFGLIFFLGFAEPADGDYTVPLLGWIITGVVIAAVIGGLLALLRKTTSPNPRAALLGTIAALFLGTAAIMLKLITELLRNDEGWMALVAALVVLGICELGAIATQQLAFRAGDLAPALGPFIGANPLFAGLIGIVVFEERFHTDPVNLIGGIFGIAMMVAGIFYLANSPLVAVGSGEVEPD